LFLALKSLFTLNRREVLLLEDLIKRIPVKLPNGAEIQVEVTPVRFARDSDVASIGEVVQDSWQEVTKAVEGIADWVWGTLQKVHPTKASVEFGIEIAVEPGKVTALLVQGSGKANLKITLEWAEKKV
jgi:Trypsin-co-occurring domain 1